MAIIEMGTEEHMERPFGGRADPVAVLSKSLYGPELGGLTRWPDRLGRTVPVAPEYVDRCLYDSNHQAGIARLYCHSSYHPHCCESDPVVSREKQIRGHLSADAAYMRIPFEIRLTRIRESALL